MVKQPPFDFGIKRLKKYLKDAGMPKKQANETLRLYKERVYTKVEEVKAKMEEELNATPTKGSVIKPPEGSV